MEPTTPENYVEHAMRTECNYEPVVERLTKLDYKVHRAGEEPPGYHFAFAGIRMVHMSLGISNEISELMAAFPENLLDEETEDKKVQLLIREELGDLCWYTAGAALVCRVEFSDLLVGASTAPDNVRMKIFSTLLMYSGVIAEQVKKHVFYGKEMDKSVIKEGLCAIVAVAQEVARRFGLDFEQILVDNIAKLRARFPDKFTEVQAIERDKDAEYSAMEGDAQ